MTLYKHILVNIHLRHLCSLTTSNTTENVKPPPNTKNQPRRMTKEMKLFFKEDPELMDVLPHIPNKYLGVNSNSPHHYLISPKIAKKIVDNIMPFMDLSGKQLIAETNAGLGLITTELLGRGVNLVRMYEACSEFRRELRDFGLVYPNHVELFTRDLFHLDRYAYLDKHDRLKRVEHLFKNVNKRSWTDEPFMTVIGPMNGLTFLTYIIRCTTLQVNPAVLGRMQIFALMRAKEYAILAATPKDSSRLYNKSTVLLQSVFNIELLDTFPKKAFLPWMGKNEIKLPMLYKNYDINLRYLVRINFKKDLPLEAEKLLHFIYFLRQFYKAGNAYVIPVLEKWLPGSGINVISPKLKHDDFPLDISIFTKFRDLSPPYVLAIYREMANHPLYNESAFRGMVQNELIMAETIESDMADVEFDSKFIEDIEEKINEAD